GDPRVTSRYGGPMALRHRLATILPFTRTEYHRGGFFREVPAEACGARLSLCREGRSRGEIRQTGRLAARTRESAARSISSSVVNRPILRRTAPRPSSGGTPMAWSTGDRQTLPS